MNWYVVRTAHVTFDEYTVEAASEEEAIADVLDGDHRHRLRCNWDVSALSDPEPVVVAIRALRAEGGEG